MRPRFLVPKLRLGTPFVEALLRVNDSRSGASRQCVPKRSLGTRIAGCCALLIAAAPFANADEPVVAPKPARRTAGIVDGDAQDLVYAAKGGPIFIRLHIQVDGRGFRSLQDEFTADLFHQLDGDKNGMLDENEAKQIPPPGQLSSTGNGGPLFAQPIDRSPKDGNVSLEELKQYVRESASSPFEIVSIAAQSTERVDLFAKLDLDGDGALSAAEVETARQALWKLDANDDETLTSTELALGRAGGETAAVRKSESNVRNVSLLLLPVEENATTDATIRRLISIYDTFSADKQTGYLSKDARLTIEEIGVEKSAFEAFDANADGKLERLELKAVFAKATPQVELLVQIDGAHDGRATFQMLSSPAAGANSVVSARTDVAQGLVLQLGEMSLDLDAKERDAARIDLVALYTHGFSRADRDKNGYLVLDEFRSLGIPPQAFRAMDRDKDEKVFQDELIDFVKRQLLLARSRVTMNVSSQNKTIFEVIDTNRNLRLSVREFQTIADRLSSWDVNGDGRVEAMEFPHGLQVAFAVGEPAIFSQLPITDAFESMGPRRMGIALTWFARMDRNRDGDISRREFLGPLNAFDKLDGNHDGLISQAEADGAK
ncbi:MAG: hypothetical protein WD648_14900 [Planctomycetaceae bacterium]